MFEYILGRNQKGSKKWMGTNWGNEWEKRIGQCMKGSSRIWGWKTNDRKIEDLMRKDNQIKQSRMRRQFDILLPLIYRTEVWDKYGKLLEPKREREN